MYISETNTVTSNVTGETCTINHKVTCGDNCLIYFLSCKCYGKKYVSETTDNFRYRWNNYKDNDRKHSRKETVCKNICLNILTAWDTMVSLKMFQEHL